MWKENGHNFLEAIKASNILKPVHSWGGLSTFLSRYDQRRPVVFVGGTVAQQKVGDKYIGIDDWRTEVEPAIEAKGLIPVNGVDLVLHAQNDVAAAGKALAKAVLCSDYIVYCGAENFEGLRFPGLGTWAEVAVAKNAGARIHLLFGGVMNGVARTYLRGGNSTVGNLGYLESIVPTKNWHTDIKSLSRDIKRRPKHYEVISCFPHFSVPEQYQELI